MVNWIGLALPFIYLGILVGSLATFSSLYRRRKACKSSLPSRILLAAEHQSVAKAASLEPWFGPHLQRDVYLSLLHIEPQPGKAKVPDSILKAALLRRACEDIHRIVQIRNSKQALANLLQRGSVGDELWQRFLRAEKEIEDEVKDVVNEACISVC
jgi:translocation protein SEC66